VYDWKAAMPFARIEADADPRASPDGICRQPIVDRAPHLVSVVDLGGREPSERVFDRDLAHVL
jgi:hypothetical protein